MNNQPRSCAELFHMLQALACRLPIVFLLSTTGCALSPGLYMQVESGENITGEPLLGGEITTTMVDASVIEQLNTERTVQLNNMRESAHALYLANLKERVSYEYRVGPNDLLNIITWGHPELNIVASSAQQGGLPRSTDSLFLNPDSPQPGHRVDHLGNIYYPYVGVISVEGKTLSEIRSTLIEKLAIYVPNPQVDVGIADFRSQRVFVLGQVQSPGAIPITQAPLEIIDAIAEVDGVTETADTRNVFLVRGSERIKIDLQSVLSGNMAQNYLLKNNDLLVVQDNRFNNVFMIGEFAGNTRLMLPPSRFYSLTDAITDNGVAGFGKNVDTARFFVFRYAVDESGTYSMKPDVYHLPLESPEQLLLASRFPLLPRDIVYAAPSGLTRWDSVIQRILPTISAIHDSARTVWFVENKLSDFEEVQRN